MDDKEKVIEICNNLIGTLNGIPKDRKPIVTSMNTTFTPPQLSRKEILRKLRHIKKKYNVSATDLLPIK